MRTILQVRARTHTFLGLAAAKISMRKMYRSLQIFFFYALVALAFTSDIDIEYFPSCVEVISVDPPPYSVVHHTKTYWTAFVVTFTKPVKMLHKDKRVYLSSSPSCFYGRKGISPRVVRSHYDLAFTSSLSKIKFSFYFKDKKGEPLFR